MPRPLFSHPLVQTMENDWSVFRAAASQTMSTAFQVWIGDSTTGNIVLTLPPGQTFQNAGKIIVVVKAVAANTVTVQPNAGDVIGFAGGGAIVLAAIDAKCMLVATHANVWMRLI